jgi:hypothetical protein
MSTNECGGTREGVDEGVEGYDLTFLGSVKLSQGERDVIVRGSDPSLILEVKYDLDPYLVGLQSQLS